MKKYNTFKSKWIFIGLIALILMFLFAIKFVYPFLGARHNLADKTIGTAVVTINCSNNNEITRNSTSITPKSAKIMPGDTLTAKITIKNSGDADIYCLFKVEASVTITGLPPIEVIDKYYTYTGSTFAELTKTGPTYNENAYELSPNGAFSINFPIEFSGTTFGNDFKNATINYTVTALGIQKANIASANAATQQIMEIV